ncbi:MAG: glycosyltransferase family protein [Deltaproteobacteria bacterium]|nr:glycosyltransferase family protein [Deltaproteobacteria bacterium]
MRTVCIIQARMGSTRLPGKVLMDIAGKTMIERVVERARRIAGVDDVVVATSLGTGDDTLVDLCVQRGYPYFRGDENDVLDRYLGAARQHRAEAVARVTADCPLLDPEVSATVVREFAEKSPEYASNTLERTYPRGLDTEVLPLEVLEIAGREAMEKADREHVTRFVWRQPHRFRLLSIRREVDQSRHRWTVDTVEDLALVRRLYNEFGKDEFNTDEVLSLLAAHPDWVSINANVEQKKT